MKKTEKRTANGLDWPGLMHAGMRGLGLKPGEFWALTPAELWLLLGPEAGEMPMGRTQLDEMSRNFPDVGVAAGTQPASAAVGQSGSELRHADET